MRFLALPAFLLAALNAVTAQQPTQADSTGSVTQYRSPAVARNLSVIPGWGYVYTGEYLRGYGTWVGTIAGPVVGASFFEVPCGILIGDCSRNQEVVLEGVGALIIGASLWAYVSSIRDAAKSAERANIRHARKIEVRPVLTAPASTGGLNAGVALRW
jgi:hypothetical protein